MQFSALKRAIFRNKPEDMQKGTQKHFARGQEGSTMPPKSELGIMENTKTIKGNLFCIRVAGNWSTLVHCRNVLLEVISLNFACKIAYF